jgi:hypothetical protein
MVWIACRNHPLRQSAKIDGTQNTVDLPSSSEQQRGGGGMNPPSFRQLRLLPHIDSANDPSIFDGLLRGSIHGPARFAIGGDEFERDTVPYENGLCLPNCRDPCRMS